MKTQLHNQLIFFVAALLFCCISNYSFASHNAGGELSYVHLGGNQYKIRCVLYRDCFGIPAPTQVIVYIESASCSQSLNTPLLTIAGTGQEITYPCPTAQTTCNGGMNPGVQKWEYEGIVFLPAQCADWIFYVTDCCRNAAITTLSGAAGMGLYIEARLDNLTGDNSSAQFTVDPIIFACIGQDLHFNNGMIDPDGDSLVTILIAARTDANTNIVYNPGYTAQQPLTSSPLISLDPFTGDFFIHPTAPEVGVIVYQILEYRNGNLIGSVMRDVQMYTISCTNNTPAITGINGTTQQIIYMLPGTPACFDVFSYDADPGDSLVMYWNDGIPAATFFSFPNPLPTASFCWTPTPADVRSQPYSFSVTVRDNNCPMNNHAVFSYFIYVTMDSSLVTPLTENAYISGKVFWDMDGNGMKDSLEPFFPNRRIDVQPDNLRLYTNINGEYRFFGWMNGTHQISASPPVFWTVTTDSLNYTVVDDTVIQTGFDFGMNAMTPFNKVDVSVAGGLPRCNTNVPHWINYENAGSTLANGRIILVIDSATSFTSSFPAPDQISGDSLIFNFIDLMPFTQDQIYVTLHYPGAGDTVDLEVIAQYDSAATFYTSSSQQLQQVVVCSCDPNDKTVLPQGLYSDHRTLYTDPLQYTIRFQNTGNDTAFAVLIQDYIDQSFDLNTFHITGSSHDVSATIYPNRMAEFRFDHILLPDSGVDEAGSQGFVQFSIKPNTNLALPVVVNNAANIFFDSNFPILTNNVWNTLVSDLSVGIEPVTGTGENISIVPNPFSSNTRIIFSKSFINTESTFILLDAMGRTIESRTVNASEILIARGNLNSGIYFFELRNEAGNRATGKLVVE